MGQLNSQQFAGRVNAGGSSRMLHDSSEPPGARGDYAVGLPGHERVYNGAVTRQAVAAHRQRLLADPTVSSHPAAMQGGWQHEGQAYLDASVKVQGRRAAQAGGRAGQQIAVYDMHNDRDVYMKQGPARKSAREKTAAGQPHKVRGSRAVGFTVHPR